MNQPGGGHPWASVGIRRIRGPVRFELYELIGSRRVYLGDLGSISEARGYVGRFLPDREFRLVVRAGLEQRAAMVMGLRPSFGRPAEGRTLYWAMELFEDLDRGGATNEQSA